MYLSLKSNFLTSSVANFWNTSGWLWRVHILSFLHSQKNSCKGPSFPPPGFSNEAASLLSQLLEQDLLWEGLQICVSKDMVYIHRVAERADFFIHHLCWGGVYTNNKYIRKYLEKLMKSLKLIFGIFVQEKSPLSPNLFENFPHLYGYVTRK